MNSLKQLLLLNSIPNNSDKENMELVSSVLKLKFKCGCPKFILYNYSGSARINLYTCFKCDAIGCANSFAFGLCPTCFKLKYDIIEYDNNSVNLYRKDGSYCTYAISFTLKTNKKELTVDEFFKLEGLCKN